MKEAISTGKKAGGVWCSKHFFYHLEEKHDELLVKLVRCLDDYKLTGDIEKYFFIRYWEGGPHLRLRYQLTETGNHKHLDSELEQVAYTFWEQFPTTNQLSQERYNTIFAEVPDSDSSMEKQLYPSEKIVDIPYHPEVERYGSGELMELSEQLFEQSSYIAVDIIWRVTGQTSSSRRLILCCGLLVELEAILLKSYLPEKRQLHTYTISYWEKSGISVDTKLLNFLKKNEVGILSTAHQLKKMYAKELREIYKLVDKITELCPSRDFYFGVASSHMRMTSNRLGIFPYYEVCCLQFLLERERS